MTASQSGKALKGKEQAYFLAMESTSFASPFFRCAGGGMDRGANTERWDHSYSVSASASVPSSQLCIVHQFTVIVRVNSGRGEEEVDGEETDL